MSYRIGLGYDVHQLAEGETLWIGGGCQISNCHGDILQKNGRKGLSIGLLALFVAT